MYFARVYGCYGIPLYFLQGGLDYRYMQPVAVAVPDELNLLNFLTLQPFGQFYFKRWFLPAVRQPDIAVLYSNADDFPPGVEKALQPPGIAPFRVAFFVELLHPLPAFVVGLNNGLHVLGVNAEASSSS